MQIREAEKACRKIAEDALKLVVDAANPHAVLAASEEWTAAAQILKRYEDGSTVPDQDLVQIFRHLMLADALASGLTEAFTIRPWSATIADMLKD